MKRYCGSVMWILVATSLAKFYSTTGSAKVLDIPEALLPMTIRQALWLAGAVEIVIALYLWRGRNDLIKLVSVAWLGGNFLLYRLAAMMLTVGKPCPCLGSITEKLPFKPVTVERLLTAVVLYLFFGSLFFLFRFGTESWLATRVGSNELRRRPRVEPRKLLGRGLDCHSIGRNAKLPRQELQE